MSFAVSHFTARRQKNTFMNTFILRVFDILITVLNYFSLRSMLISDA